MAGTLEGMTSDEVVKAFKNNEKLINEKKQLEDEVEDLKLRIDQIMQNQHHNNPRVMLNNSTS